MSVLFAGALAEVVIVRRHSTASTNVLVVAIGYLHIDSVWQNVRI